MDGSRVCLDTSALIAFLRGQEPGASAVDRALFGVARARKEIGEEALLGCMTVLPFDEAAARRAADVHAHLIRQNQDIGVKDVLISAVCLEHASPLLTLNERHFARVPGLSVVAPAQLLAR